VSYPTALLFDLDGTLVDSAPGICASARAACVGLGYAEPADDVVRPMIGLSIDHVARAATALDLDNLALAAWVARYRLEFNRVALPATTTFLDVPEELARWRAAGRRLAVVTSKRTDIALAVIDRVGLTELFDVIVGGDQAPRGKPAPDLALHALAKLEVRAREAAMVGDTAHDVGMARAADLPVYAVTYGAHDRSTLAAARPTAIVDTFRELAQHLG
jgi:phosphoglycolate phosphatase